MKTKFSVLAVLPLFALTLATFAEAKNFNDKQYALTVQDERSGAIGSQGLVNSGVMVFVYDAGTHNLSTIYADRKRTAKTNPISRAQFATDGEVLFYGSSASYDIVLSHSDGSNAKVAGVTPVLHRLMLVRSYPDKILVLPFLNNGTTEVSTGVTLPYDSIVTDVAVEVVTAESGKTLSVGLLSSESGGSATGFVNAVSTTSTGYPTLSTFTTGASETFFASSVLGAFLFKGDAGVDTALHYGSYFRSPKIITGGAAHTVSFTGSSGSTSAAGYFYLFFRNLR
jgi:hypothetical protein